jgi:hypothetical protein
MGTLPAAGVARVTSRSRLAGAVPCAVLLLVVAVPAARGLQAQPASPAQAQAAALPQAQAAIVPQNITVGDVFHAAVRVELPPGSQLAAPDSLVLPPELELAGSRQLRIDTTAGGRRATILYPLSAWRPGDYVLPSVDVQLIGDGGARTLRIDLPSFTVTSVLPADTAGVEPQPARDVLGASRLWWPILLALLLAALIALALYMWWRRRRRAATVDVPVVVVLPRTAALERLAALERAGYIERGDMKPFYEQLTETLRRYAASVRPEWSVDLTTSELLLRAGDDGDAAELLSILAGADLIKFARGRAVQQEARADLTAARAWVERVDAAPPEPEDVATGSEERRVA